MSESAQQGGAEAGAVFAILRFDRCDDANARVHALVRDESLAAREVARLNRAHAGRGAVFVWQPARVE